MYIPCTLDTPYTLDTLGIHPVHWEYIHSINPGYSLDTGLSTLDNE